MPIVAAPLIAILAIFYGTFPEIVGTLPRVPLINYLGTFLIMLVVLGLMRFGGLVERLRA